MTFTVLTATYNRRALLRRCFESLLMQEGDFEWLVIDDGSTDGTAQAVSAWASEASFPVRILCKENGGKHTAINLALRQELREFTILLDSDDMLAPDSIRRLAELVSGIDLAVGGVIGNIHDSGSGAVIGTPIPEGITATTGRELRESWGVTGDTFRMYRSSMLSRHPFPEFEGENFVPENVLFDPVDVSSRLLVGRDVYCLCEYQPSGLSGQIMLHRARSPRGFAAGLESTAWVSQRPRLVIEYTIKFQVWCRVFMGHYGRNSFRRRGAFAACLPAAVVLHALHRPSFIFRTHQSADANTAMPEGRSAT